MTVAVIEAGEGATSRAASKRATGSVVSSRYERPKSRSYSTYNTRARTPRATVPGGQERRAASRASRTTDNVARARQAYGKQAGSIAENARLTPGARGYQPVILAEFLAAVVIVALTPIATGGSETAKAKGAMSPYDTGDLRQLVAVGGVYFVLALFSSGNSGRLSAWLGGLVLIALGMSKLAHGNLTAVFNTVSGQPPQGEGGQTGIT